MFDQVEEDYVLPPQSDGSVQRVLRLALEHRVQQGSSHVREVRRREIILKDLCNGFLG